MSGSAQIVMNGNNNNLSNVIELRRLISVLNQKILREKFEKYSIVFEKSDVDVCQGKNHVLEDKRATSSSEESEISREVFDKVGNVYKTKLLKEFRKKKTFLKEVNIN